MAQITNSMATFNSSRVREQLANKIYNVSVDETPATALMSKGTALGPFEEWPTDSFRAGANNKVEQGNLSTPTARSDIIRLNNRTQISEDVLGVTGTQQAVEKAGSNDEVAYQKTKAMVALKKDVEFGALQNTTAIAAAAGVAPQARGLLGFIDTNTDFGATGVNPNPVTNTAPTDGTQRAFSETLLKNVLKLMFDNGAPMDNLYALIPSAQRTNFDAMLAGQTRFDKAEDKTLTATLEVYIGPFGRVKAVNARHMRSRDLFIINPEYVELATLKDRGMKATALAKRGDVDEFLVNTEWTLKVLNTKAHGAIRDLT